MRLGTEEGVVTLKSIGNGLIAVVYTTGILKVWSATQCRCLLIHELESDIDEKERIRVS